MPSFIMTTNEMHSVRGLFLSGRDFGREKRGIHRIGVASSIAQAESGVSWHQCAEKGNKSPVDRVYQVRPSRTQRSTNSLCSPDLSTHRVEPTAKSRPSYRAVGFLKWSSMEMSAIRIDPTRSTNSRTAF